MACELALVFVRFLASSATVLANIQVRLDILARLYF